MKKKKRIAQIIKIEWKFDIVSKLKRNGILNDAYSNGVLSDVSLCTHMEFDPFIALSYTRKLILLTKQIQYIFVRLKNDNFYHVLFQHTRNK